MSHPTGYVIAAVLGICLGAGASQFAQSGSAGPIDSPRIAELKALASCKPTADAWNSRFNASQEEVRATQKQVDGMKTSFLGCEKTREELVDHLRHVQDDLAEAKRLPLASKSVSEDTR